MSTAKHEWCADWHVTHNCDDCGVTHIAWSGHEEFRQQWMRYGSDVEAAIAEVERVLADMPPGIAVEAISRLDERLRTAGWEFGDVLE
jgi:hypothetical protein